MLEKLSRYGIQDNELNWFTDYLFLRKQIVQFKGVLSETNPVFTGVPQESILGPLLFLIHFNDVHKSLSYSKTITYADDTVIFTSSKDLDAIQHNLSEDISSLASWFRDNELIINLRKGKTEVMLFGTAKRLNGFDGNELNLSVNGNRIDTTTNYKYLGVHLDSTLNLGSITSRCSGNEPALLPRHERSAEIEPTLNLDMHFCKTYKKAAGEVNLLRRIRSNTDTLSAERIYRAMIMPIFTYCGQITLGWSETSRRQIRSLEQRSHRIILQSSKCLNCELRLPTIEFFFKEKGLFICF